VTDTEKADSTLEKRAYGAVCSFCNQQFLIGFALLPRGAQLEELRNEVQAKGGVDLNVTCHRIVRGDECLGPNYITRDDLVFVDDSVWPLDRLADSLSRG